MKQFATPNTGPQRSGGFSDTRPRRNGNRREMRTKSQANRVITTRQEAGFFGWLIRAAATVSQVRICTLGSGCSARAEVAGDSLTLTFCSEGTPVRSVELCARRIRRGSHYRKGDSVEYRGPWADQLQYLIDQLAGDELRSFAVLIAGGRFALPAA